MAVCKRMMLLISYSRHEPTRQYGKKGGPWHNTPGKSGLGLHTLPEAAERLHHAWSVIQKWETVSLRRK